MHFAQPAASLIIGVAAYVLAQSTPAPSNAPPSPAPAAWPSPAPSPSPTPSGPIYAGNPATRFTVEQRPLGFDADGNARWLVVTHFWDANGQPTRIMANSDIDWLSHDGYVQWQTRMRYGQPAAILKTTRNGPLALTVRANMPKLGSITVRTDTRTWRFARVVAQALGPHSVKIGWFPKTTSSVAITRIDNRTKARLAMAATAGSSSIDQRVEPGTSYTYVVRVPQRPAVTISNVVTPPAPPSTTVSMAAGKAMWLFFSTNPIDDNYFGKWNPQQIVDTAVRAGLHYVELRTAYGAYFEVTPEAKPKIDAVIDGLADHGIGTMGWTVPRDTSFEDLQASVATAYYRTARGTPLTGLAIDVERGDEFMGGDPRGLAALWIYMRDLRAALGPNYLLVATVEDPYFEHLDNAKYPFAKIAQYSDVLQPMAYWRMMKKQPTTAAQVRAMLPQAVKTLLQMSGKELPVSIGGQTSAEGPNGHPPADEITASLDAAKAAGAIGECFFDWDGALPDQWDALAAYPWSV